MKQWSTRTTILVVVCCTVLIVGLGMKILRYVTPPQRMTQSFDVQLTQFLSDTGWQRVQKASENENKAVQIITFRKRACTEPLRISIVGTTSGLESYLRQQFGDDIAFVQHGSVRPHPSLLRFQIVRAWQRMVAYVVNKPEPRRPILAVTPAPREDATSCMGPTIAQWQSF